MPKLKVWSCHPKSSAYSALHTIYQLMISPIYSPMQSPNRLQFQRSRGPEVPVWPSEMTWAQLSILCPLGSPALVCKQCRCMHTHCPLLAVLVHHAQTFHSPC